MPGTITGHGPAVSSHQLLNEYRSYSTYQESGNALMLVNAERRILVSRVGSLQEALRPESLWLREIRRVPVRLAHQYADPAALWNVIAIELK
jgi:hypothetical protein